MEIEIFKREAQPPPEIWTIQKARAAVEAAQAVADDHPLQAESYIERGCQK